MSPEGTHRLDLVVGLTPMTAGALLHGFEAVRRVLAEELHGSTGVFTGFLRLDIDERVLGLLAVGDEVAITAMVVRDSPRQTHVGFTATFARVTATGWRADVQVAGGTGVIVYPTDAGPSPHRDPEQQPHPGARHPDPLRAVLA